MTKSNPDKDKKEGFLLSFVILYSLAARMLSSQFLEALMSVCGLGLSISLRQLSDKGHLQSKGAFRDIKSNTPKTLFFLVLSKHESSVFRLILSQVMGPCLYTAAQYVGITNFFNCTFLFVCSKKKRTRLMVTGLGIFKRIVTVKWWEKNIQLYEAPEINRSQQKTRIREVKKIFNSLMYFLLKLQAVD